MVEPCSAAGATVVSGRVVAKALPEAGAGTAEVSAKATGAGIDAVVLATGAGADAGAGASTRTATGSVCAGGAAGGGATLAGDTTAASREAGVVIFTSGIGEPSVVLWAINSSTRYWARKSASAFACWIVVCEFVPDGAAIGSGCEVCGGFAETPA